MSKITARAINMARRFTSSNDFRPILHAISLKDGNVAATDSFRLVIVRDGADKDLDMLVPNELSDDVMGIIMQKHTPDSNTVARINTLISSFINRAGKEVQ